MSLEGAIKYAKGATDEKTGFRFQFPVAMKNEFEELCNKYGVSMTDMILGLINTSIEESKGITDVPLLNVIHKLEELEKSYGSLHDTYEKTGESVLQDIDGNYHYIKRDMDSLKIKITVLEEELRRRTKK